MRIGIDARPLARQRAGIGTYVYNIVKMLNETDRENEYYLFSCREVFVDFPLGKNWTVVVEPQKVGTLWLAFRGNALIKQYHIDVFWGTQHVLPLGKVKGVKYVLTICDLAQFKVKDIGSTYNSIIQKLFVSGSCRRADRIIAISESTKYDIVSIFGIESAKIKCIYLGGTMMGPERTEEEIAQVKEKFHISGKYFLYVSTIEPRKNVDTIIRAFETFMTREKKEYMLVLAGGLGWKYDGILEQIEKSPYKASIIRTGFISQEEKQCLFSGADTFIYPSLYEGFGIPILEAMNYGLPIITTNISSLPEVGQNAVFYLNELKNSDELAKLMVKCAALTTEEREEIARMDEKQRNRFSWDKCAKETRAELIES